MNPGTERRQHMRGFEDTYVDIIDTASLIQQLGFDLREKAREFGNQVDWDSLRDQRFGEPERLPGQGKPEYRSYKSGSFDVEDFVQVTNLP